MKRLHISMLALLLAACMVLTACDSDEEISEESVETEASAEIEETAEPTEEVAEIEEPVEEYNENEVYQEDGYVPHFPTPDDPLTQSVEFPDNKGIELKFPETLYGAQVEQSNAFRFIAMDCGYSDDPWATIEISLDPITDEYTKYMESGQMVARKAMEILTAHLLEKHINQDNIIKVMDPALHDGKTYWEMTQGLILDGSDLEGMEGQEVCQHDYLGMIASVRFYGDSGYVLTTFASAVDKDVLNYYDLATKMRDSVNVSYNWSTKSKLVPNKPKKKYANKRVQGSDAGDYGTPYNWEDEDGNIWHFNGYEDEYMGDCVNYLVDDSGYIVNASDPGDTYYDEDYSYDYYDWDW